MSRELKLKQGRVEISVLSPHHAFLKAESRPPMILGESDETTEISISDCNAEMLLL